MNKRNSENIRGLFKSSEIKSAIEIISSKKLGLRKTKSLPDEILEIFYDDSPDSIIFEKYKGGNFYDFYLYLLPTGDCFQIMEPN